MRLSASLCSATILGFLSLSFSTTLTQLEVSSLTLSCVQRHCAAPPRLSRNAYLKPNLRFSKHATVLGRTGFSGIRLRGGSPEWQGRTAVLGSEEIAEKLQRYKNDGAASRDQLVVLLKNCAQLTESGDVGGVLRAIQLLETAAELTQRLDTEDASDSCRRILESAQQMKMLKQSARLLALMEAVHVDMPLSQHRSVVSAVAEHLSNMSWHHFSESVRASPTTAISSEYDHLPLTNSTEVELPEHPKLVRGTLPNGFRYAILPNKQPPNRMCATLQVHVGSLEEQDDEQGIAHYLEHMLFAGTRRYPSRGAMKDVLALLGMSSTADQNAQTSFRTTSYTASSPCSTSDAKEGGHPEQENVGLVIDLLHQMAFHALLEDEAIDAERGVILSELQDRNTVGFRQTKAFYEQVYNETELPNRFPRGKEDQVARWNATDLRNFYNRFYCASNMDLFVVGDVDPAHVHKCINDTFGSELAAPRACPEQAAGALLWATSGVINWVMPPIDLGPLCAWTQRGVEVDHEFGEPLAHRFRVMAHELTPEVRISWFEKEPMPGRHTRASLSDYMTECLIGNILGLRKNALVQGLGDPPFTGMGWSKGLRSNEDCVLNSFFVSAEPHRWRDAVVLAVREVCKLTRFGAQPDELETAKASVLAGYRQRAERVDTISSGRYMAKLISCAESCTAFMDQVQEDSLARDLMPNITLDEVNRRVTELFQIVTNYPNESTSGCFVTSPNSGAHNLTVDEVVSLVQKACEDLEEPTSISLPAHLISPQDVETLVSDTQPSWRRWRKDGGEWHEGELQEEAQGAGEGRAADQPAETGREGLGDETIVEMELSNGVRINMLRTKHQPKECNVLITALGSESAEQQAGGPATVQVGVKSWARGGCGGHSSDLISRFCARWNIHTEANVGAEGVALRAAFTTGEGDAACMDKTFQLLHLLLRKPDFDPLAFERSIKQVGVAHERMCKSLHAATRQRFEALLTDTPDLRLVQLSPKDVEGCTLQEARACVERVVGADRLEVCVVGDFDPAEFQRLARAYFGTLSPGRSKSDGPARVQFRSSSARDNVTVVDDVEQHSVVMGFPTVNVWGQAAQDPEKPKSGLHLKLCLHLASRIISNRLFAQVREKMGLVYSISFRWQGFQVLPGGIAIVQYMPKTGTAAVTEAAVKKVLGELLSDGFSDDEFIKVQRPVAAKSRDATSTNGWWLNNMQFLQLGDAPFTARDISDLPAQVERMCREEVQEAMQTHWKGALDRLVVVCGSTGNAKETEVA